MPSQNRSSDPKLLTALIPGMHELELPSDACTRPGNVSFAPDAAADHAAEIGALSGDRLLTYQALRLLRRLDGELRYARADFNQDWFRRIMRARSKAVIRVRRRLARLSPERQIPLGCLHRRYHANVAGYLYQKG